MTEPTWVDVDEQAFQQADEEAQSRRVGMATYWKPTAGPAGSPKRHCIRLLPPHRNMRDASGRADVFTVVRVHFLPSNEIDTRTGRPVAIMVNCLRDDSAGPPTECPACDSVERLRAEARNETDENPETAHQLEAQARDRAARIRAFASIVDMDHPERGVQRYAFGPDVERKLRACFKDDDGNFRNIANPKTGRDVLLFVAKKPKTDFNEYEIRVKERDSEIVDWDWLEKVEDLSELRRRPTRDEVQRAVRGERMQPAAASAQPVQAAATARKPKTAAEKAAEKSAEKPAEPKAAAVAQEPEPAKPRRQPVVDEAAAEPEVPADPYARARKHIARFHSKTFAGPFEITPEQAASVRKPSCYEVDTDPEDLMCQTCRVLLPCQEAKIARGLVAV